MEFKDQPTACHIAHIDLEQLSKSLSKKLNVDVKFDISTFMDNGVKKCKCFFRVGDYREIRVVGEDQTVTDGTEMVLRTQQEFFERCLEDLVKLLISAS